MIFSQGSLNDLVSIVAAPLRHAGRLFDSRSVVLGSDKLKLKNSCQNLQRNAPHPQDKIPINLNFSKTFKLTLRRSGVTKGKAGSSKQPTVPSTSRMIRNCLLSSLASRVIPKPGTGFTAHEFASMQAKVGTQQRTSFGSVCRASAAFGTGIPFFNEQDCQAPLANFLPNHYKIRFILRVCSSGW